MLSHETPFRPWECVRADIFAITNKHYLCIVDYQSRFLVIKQVNGLSVDNLIKTCKIIFAAYGLSSKLTSDAGTNLVSEKFKDLCRCLDSHHMVSNHIIFRTTGKQRYASSLLSKQ